jgi:Mrp family chromosome partitioning ATPase
MVGSVNPKEGRTFTAVNLAELFASSGVRVCLLDLDFSKPGLLDFFPNAANEKSPIVDVFPKECGFKMSKVDANLSLITPNPTTANMSELLETREFESALNALEVYYELIIVDTPPLNGHMEAVIAAQYADAFLLVINQRRTLRTEVEEAIRVLQSSLKLPIWGVMNFIFDEVAQGRRKGKKLEREQRRKSPPVAPPTDERAA